MAEKKTPFRANHVGSLLRPPELLQARFSFFSGSGLAITHPNVVATLPRLVIRVIFAFGVAGAQLGPERGMAAGALRVRV